MVLVRPLRSETKLSILAGKWRDELACCVLCAVKPLESDNSHWRQQMAALPVQLQTPRQSGGFHNLGNILQPETILPAQLNVGARKLPRGELKLMAAVLNDALRCYFKSMHQLTSKARAEFEELRRWFQSDNEKDLFAYASLCRALDLDPGQIRSWLNSLLPSNRNSLQYRRGARVGRVPSTRSAT